MNENTFNTILTQLGNTIGQLSVDLSIARATNQELAQEIEKLNEELSNLKAQPEVPANN